MGIFFIKLPEHYVFDYKPMYYDPKKEEREKRFKKIDESLKKDGESYRPNIKFRRYYSYHKRTHRNALFNLIITLMIMALLFLMFLQTPFLEKLFEFIK